MSEPVTTPPHYLIVSAEDHGRLLREIVEREVGEAADTLIQRGGLWVDRARTFDADVAAREGSYLGIRPPPSGRYMEIEIQPEWIIYEDHELLVLNKPVNCYVVETPWDIEGNLLAALRRYLRARDGEAPPLHPAHRLDRDTSGVLLFSRAPSANAPLQQAFASGLAQKTYLAHAAGEPTEDDWTMETGHGRQAFGFFRVYPLEEVGRELPGGTRVKRMETRFIAVQRQGDATLLQALPHTGRTHQIRLHLAHLGLPLIGDPRYGGPSEWRGQPALHHRLHAQRLVIPWHKSQLILEAPAPAWAEPE